MIRSTDEFRSLLRAARCAGTPLLCIRTADPASALDQIRGCTSKKTAILVWDIVDGVRGANQGGVRLSAECFGEQTAIGPVDLLSACHKLRKHDAVFLLSNAHRIWDQPDVLQAVWNLRDTFKAGGQSLIY